MSRIEGKECKKFSDAYYGVIKENPDLDDQQHEIATFVKLIHEELNEIGDTSLLSEKALNKITEFVWRFWRYGFTYDYPDESDYKDGSV